jgi:hypothetical protein
VGDVGVVGVVAGPGEFAQAVDDSTDLALLAEDGMVEGQGQLQDGFGRGNVGVAGLNAQIASGFEAALGDLAACACSGPNLLPSR